jgi:hypothetical protein
MSEEVSNLLKRLAESEAARITAEQYAAELSRSLEAINLSLKDRVDVSSTFAQSSALITRTSLNFPSERLLSPTSTDAPCFIEGDYAALLDAPVTLPTNSTLALDFRRVLIAGGTAREIMRESNMYVLATSILPRFAKTVGSPSGDMTASAIFTNASLRSSLWSFSSGCKPELHVRAAAGDDGEPKFRPAYNGELKSAGDSRALEQAAYYAAMDMVRVFFPARDNAPCKRRFFSRAPLGFALVAFPHVGYFIALEWIGKLLVSPVSAPFLLGSTAHSAAADALPDERYDDPYELNESLEWVTPNNSDKTDRVAWSISDGVFRKLVRGDARSGAAFSSMFRAYKRLNEVLSTHEPPESLHLIAYARLYFGAHELLIEMPAVAGREATEDDMKGVGDGKVLSNVAATFVWLARRCLVHVDLRAPNVIVDANGYPWLVDFDDMVVTPEAVNSLEGFRDVLQSLPAATELCTFATSFLSGGQSEISAALAEAFDRVET